MSKTTSERTALWTGEPYRIRNLENGQVYIVKVGSANCGQSKREEEKLLRAFPPGLDFQAIDGNYRYFEHPLTILDAEKKILLWHLPDVISTGAQVSIRRE